MHWRLTILFPRPGGLDGAEHRPATEVSELLFSWMHCQKFSQQHLQSFTGKNAIIKKNGERQILVCEAYVLFDSLNISPLQFESTLNPSGFQSGTHREEFCSCFLAALACFLLSGIHPVQHEAATLPRSSTVQTQPCPHCWGDLLSESSFNGVLSGVFCYLNRATKMIEGMEHLLSGQF